MKTKRITKPVNVNDEIWQDNQHWLNLMNAEAEQHRQSRDPKLYRQSAQAGLISPTPKNDA